MSLEFDRKNTTLSTHEEEIKKETVEVTSVSTGIRVKGTDTPFKQVTVRTHVDLAYPERFKLPIEEGKKRLESCTAEGEAVSRGERVALAAFAKKVAAGDLAIGEDAVKEEQEAQAKAEAEAKAKAEAAEAPEASSEEE